MEIAEAVRARLAVAGREPPDDPRERERMEEDLALHLARVETLAGAGEPLGPGDPPYTDPTGAARRE